MISERILNQSTPCGAAELRCPGRARAQYLAERVAEEQAKLARSEEETVALTRHCEELDAQIAAQNVHAAELQAQRAAAEVSQAEAAEREREAQAALKENLAALKKQAAQLAAVEAQRLELEAKSNAQVSTSASKRAPAGACRRALQQRRANASHEAVVMDRPPTSNSLRGKSSAIWAAANGRYPRRCVSEALAMASALAGQ